MVAAATCTLAIVADGKLTLGGAPAGPEPHRFDGGLRLARPLGRVMPEAGGE